MAKEELNEEVLDNEQNGEPGSEQEEQDNPVKQFTQSELNKMMAREKGRGENKVLKALGVESLEEAQKILKAYHAEKEANKTDAEKEAERIAQLAKEKLEAEQAAKLANDKLKVIEGGVVPQYAEDVLIIAKSKLKDDNTIAEVIEAMKEDAAYCNFFGEKETGGTGTSRKPARKQSESFGDYGKRLAEARAKQTPQENPYFKK